MNIYQMKKLNSMYIDKTLFDAYENKIIMYPLLIEKLMNLTIKLVVQKYRIQYIVFIMIKEFQMNLISFLMDVRGNLCSISRSSRKNIGCVSTGLKILLMQHIFGEFMQ